MPVVIDKSTFVENNYILRLHFRIMRARRLVTKLQNVLAHKRFHNKFTPTDRRILESRIRKLNYFIEGKC